MNAENFAVLARDEMKKYQRIARQARITAQQAKAPKVPAPLPIRPGAGARQAV